METLTQKALDDFNLWRSKKGSGYDCELYCNCGMNWDMIEIVPESMILALVQEWLDSVGVITGVKEKEGMWNGYVDSIMVYNTDDTYWFSSRINALRKAVTVANTIYNSRS